MPDRPQAVRQRPRPVPDPRGDRYRPIREIARGGMGRVLEAVDVNLERTVALKEILDQHPEARARFEREVEITARLEHPSIVPLYDAGVSADGTPFYVMRKVSGDPLDALIREAKTLDQRLTLLPNVLAVANAMAHAHGRGVIHRDLKPSNVLVGDLGETIVIDWGLAKFIGDDDLAPAAMTESERPAGASLHTVAGTVFGTPGFMAPEQVAGDEADARADVYALGACLYQVLAGKAPFHGLSESQVFQQTMAATPPALASIAPGVPPDLVTIVEKAMARDRDDRYLDAGGLVEDLRRFLGGQLVASHHYSVGVRLMRWLRKNRAVVAAVSIALTALIVLGTILVRRILAERERAEAAAARELERSEDLIVAQAHSYIETNPTLAASSLQQLPPQSSWWPRLAATVADIRARGVAFALDLPPGMVTVARPAPDASDRFLVSGYGGLMLYDVVKRTATVVTDNKTLPHGLWAGPDLVIVQRKAGDELVVAATNAHTPAPWGVADEITTDDAGTVIVLDDKGGLAAYTATAAGVSAAVPLPPLPTQARTVDLSPSGRWLGVASKTAAYLLQRRGSELAWDVVLTLEGPDGVIDFESTEKRAAIRAGQVIHLIDLATTTEITYWNSPMGVPYFAAGKLYLWSMGKVTELGEKTSFPVDTRNRSRLVEIGSAIARVQPDGNIEIKSGDATYRLQPPYPVDYIMARPGGAYLIGTTKAKLLVWNMSEILATRSKVPSGEGLALIGSTSFRAAPSFAPIETPNGPRQPFYRYAIGPDRLTVRPDGIGQLPLDSATGTYRDGTIIFDNRSSDQWGVLEPKPVQVVGIGGIEMVRPYGAKELLVSTITGEIHRVDRATGRSTELLEKLPGTITTITERNGWIFARSADSTMWRRDPRGMVERTTSIATPSYLGPDGTAYLTTDTEVLAWAPRTEIAALFTLPAGSTPSVVRASERAVAVQISDGSIKRFDRATSKLLAVLPPVTDIVLADVLPRAACVINGGIHVVDLDTGDSWRVLEQVTKVDGMQLTSDGEVLYVAARTAQDTAEIHAWKLFTGTPRDWILQATNALPPTTTQRAIEWR